MLLFGGFRLSVVFSVALETLASRFLPIGLVFRRELYNCLVDSCFWLGSLSRLQWRKFLTPPIVRLYNPPDFYILFSVNPNLFCTCHKILRKRGGFLGSLGIYFRKDNIPSCGLCLFSRTSKISDLLWRFKHLKGVGHICSTLLRQHSIFPSLGITGLLNVRMYACACISSPPILLVILL